LAIDTVLKKVDAKFNFLKYVKIDSTRYSDGINAISIMANIDDVNSLDMGRAIQKLLEEIIKTLGDAGGQYFIDEFKNSLEKCYLVQIEEMGVNLHIVQLRQNFLL